MYFSKIISVIEMLSVQIESENVVTNQLYLVPNVGMLKKHCNLVFHE